MHLLPELLFPDSGVSSPEIPCRHPIQCLGSILQQECLPWVDSGHGPRRDDSRYQSAPTHAGRLATSLSKAYFAAVI
jgi:hypothetical protein